MKRRDLRRYNHYLNSHRDSAQIHRIQSGQMGARDINTGKYFTTLDNSGTYPTRFLGLSNAKNGGCCTEVDTLGWSDN